MICIENYLFKFQNSLKVFLLFKLKKKKLIVDNSLWKFIKIAIGAGINLKSVVIVGGLDPMA